MAKITKSQSFSKAVLYRDSVTGRWKVDECGKDSTITYDLFADILLNWENVEDLSLTIKQDALILPKNGEGEEEN